MMVTMMMVMMMIIVIVIKMTKQFSFHQLSLSVSGEINAEKDAVFAPPACENLSLRDCEHGLTKQLAVLGWLEGFK